MTDQEYYHIFLGRLLSYSLPRSSTGLGVLERPPKRSKAFKISSEEIFFSFAEYLSISFSSLKAKNRVSSLRKTSVKWAMIATCLFGIHLGERTKILQAQINQVVIKSIFLLTPLRRNPKRIWRWLPLFKFLAERFLFEKRGQYELYEGRKMWRQYDNATEIIYKLL